MVSPLGRETALGRDILWVTVEEGLPTAAAQLRGRLAFIRGDGATTNDELYVCRLTSAGAFEWRLVS